MTVADWLLLALANHAKALVTRTRGEPGSVGYTPSCYVEVAFPELRAIMSKVCHPITPSLYQTATSLCPHDGWVKHALEHSS